MFRHVLRRAGAVALLALVPALAASADESPVRRMQERGPVSYVDPKLIAARSAVHDHLRLLGIPPDELAQALTKIDGDAQQQTIDLAFLQSVSQYALDPDGADKAADILRAYAEMVLYGQPLTVDLVTNDLTVHAMQPEKDPSEIGPDPIPGEAEPESEDRGAKLLGVCQSCPSFDFGPFTPTPIYQTHSSSLSNGSDCNWYSFNVVSGQRYEFKTCLPEGNAAWDSVLEVYDPSNCAAFVARGDQGCGSSPGPVNASLVVWDATYTGTVLVKVKAFSTSTVTGPYTLAYRTQGVVCETCINPNALPLPAPTALCQCISNTTSSTCPSNYYQVALLAGETYEFSTCPAACAAATANYDTTIGIWEPVGCTRVAFNDDGCSAAGFTTRSTVTYTPVVSGTYRVQIGGRIFTTGTIASGTYTMCYRRTSSACPTCATGPFQLPANTVPTLACQTHTGTVDACQANWYDFLLTGGTTYEFTTCSTGFCGTGAATFDTLLQLYTGCSPLVASDDNGCSGGPRSLLTYAAPSTGNYRLLVSGVAGATGNYTLTYRALSACTPPSSVSLSPSTGTVGSGTCSRTETFAVSVNSLASSPVTYTWSITPPAGGAAAPPSGVVVSASPSGAPANFTSTLTGAGTFVINVTATNACGNTTQSFNYTLLDTQAPNVNVPPDSSVPCNAVPPPGPASATDNCTATPALAFAEVRVNGPCPDTYQLRRTWTATDASANSASRTQVIQVSDTVAPVLVGVPVAATVECNAVPGPAPVTATDNCDPSPTVTYNQATTPGSCPGNYTLTRTWTATDRCGNTSTQSQVLTVVDTTPPVVVPSTTQIACLWPPNHRYACFTNSQLSLLGTDDCSGPVTWQIVGVSSSSSAQQPCGDGNQDPDVILSPDGFCVQAERCGQDNQTTGGRVYTVQAVATDACGNASAPTNVGTVFVPHDERGGLACQRADTRFGH